MTVQQLIDQLKEHQPDAQLLIKDGRTGHIYKLKASTVIASDSEEKSVELIATSYSLLAT